MCVYRLKVLVESVLGLLRRWERILMKFLSNGIHYQHTVYSECLSESNFITKIILIM